jgi:hypothetical protein
VNAAQSTAEITDAVAARISVQLSHVGHGRSADNSDPNRANYDDSRANPFPTLPDGLTTNDRQRVTTADMWRKVRKPENRRRVRAGGATLLRRDFGETIDKLANDAFDWMAGNS